MEPSPPYSVWLQGGRVMWGRSYRGRPATSEEAALMATIDAARGTGQIVADEGVALSKLLSGDDGTWQI